MAASTNDRLNLLGEMEIDPASDGGPEPVDLGALHAGVHVATTPYRRSLEEERARSLASLGLGFSSYPARGPSEAPAYAEAASPPAYSPMTPEHPPPYDPSNPGASNPIPIHGFDELPPPYSLVTGGAPMVQCKVCPTMIRLDGLQDQYTVKCNICNENTPIRSAPPGKKYVRCACNALIVVDEGNRLVTCPISICKRIIILSGSGNRALTIRPRPQLPEGMCRAECKHCKRIFIWRKGSRATAQCCYCQRHSKVGDILRFRAKIHIGVGIICLLLAVGFMIRTLTTDEDDGYSGVWIGSYGAAGVSFLLALIFWHVKTSRVIEEANDNV